MKRTASMPLTFGLMTLAALAFAAVSMGGDDPPKATTTTPVTTRTAPPPDMELIAPPGATVPTRTPRTPRRAPLRPSEYGPVPPGRRAPTRTSPRPRRAPLRPSAYGYGPGMGPLPPGAPRPIAPAAPDVPRSMAGCLLRVTYDSESLPGGTSTLVYLARSHGVLETAVTKTLDQPPPYRLDVRIIREDRRRTPILALCQMDLTLEADNAGPQARKVLAAVIDRLREALSQTADRQQKIIRQELAEVSRQVEQAREAMTKLRRERARLVKEAGVADLDRDRILSKTRKLEERRESLAVEVAGGRVGIKATQEQVARLAAKARDAAKDDPVAAELAKVVEFRMREVSRREEAFRKGTATKAEIMEAAARVAEAKARLAERRQQAAAGAAGSLLTDLNTGLANGSICLVRNEAELEAVTAQLKPLRDPKLLELAERYRTLGFELEMADRRFYEVLRRQSDLESQLSAARAPTVIVIGG